MNAAPELMPDATSNAMQQLAAFMHSTAGLVLSPEKSLMVQSRLKPRLKACGFASLEDYMAYVTSDHGGEEIRNLISALTTNVSSFFREEHHFDLMISHLKEKFEGSAVSAPRVRIWSAGCSNGQEAYSIVMRLSCEFTPTQLENTKILASDIDHEVLRFGQAACYPEKMVAGIPSDMKARFFTETSGKTGREYSANDTLRSKVVFKHLNLLSEWPISGRFDIIFCRNVVIYFDDSVQESLWPRFKDKIKQGGLLFIGHSERLQSAQKLSFKNIGPTAYLSE